MKKKTMKKAVGSYFLEETLYTSEKKKKTHFLLTILNVIKILELEEQLNLVIIS